MVHDMRWLYVEWVLISVGIVCRYVLLLLLLLFAVAVAAVAVAGNHHRNWNGVVVGRNLQIERHWKENMYSKVRIMFR